MAKDDPVPVCLPKARENFLMHGKDGEKGIFIDPRAFNDEIYDESGRIESSNKIMCVSISFDDIDCRDAYEILNLCLKYKSDIIAKNETEGKSKIFAVKLIQDSQYKHFEGPKWGRILFGAVLLIIPVVISLKSLLSRGIHES